MAWYLNRSLTTFRDAVNEAYPKRKKHSDGTIGDRAHAASVSEHNPDWDGSVDAWDMDVNLLGGSTATGTKAEKDEVEKLIEEFKKQPFAQLVIWDGHIYNRDIGNWRKRTYSGKNKHTQHVHFQSRQAREKLSYTGDLTEEETIVDAPVTGKDGKVTIQPIVNKTAPEWPIDKDKHFGPYLRSVPPYYKTVYRFQQQMRKRGWTITVDGRFGAGTLRVIKAFQKQVGLKPDGLLGPKTWKAAFTAKITDA